VILCADGENASLRRLGDRVCEQVIAEAIPHRASTVAPVVTVSIGAAWQLARSGQPPESLLEAADKLPYTAKQQGRNRVVATEDAS